MTDRTVTSHNIQDTVKSDDPHTVRQRRDREYHGKWLRLEGHGSDLPDIHDMYEAHTATDISWGILASRNNRWLAIIIKGNEYTSEHHNSMYRARNAVFEGVWNSLDVTPSKEW